MNTVGFHPAAETTGSQSDRQHLNECADGGRTLTRQRLVEEERLKRCKYLRKGWEWRFCSSVNTLKCQLCNNSGYQNNTGLVNVIQTCVYIKLARFHRTGVEVLGTRRPNTHLAPALACSWVNGCCGCGGTAPSAGERSHTSGSDAKPACSDSRTRRRSLLCDTPAWDNWHNLRR